MLLSDLRHLPSLALLNSTVGVPRPICICKPVINRICKESISVYRADSKKCRDIDGHKIIYHWYIIHVSRSLNVQLSTTTGLNSLVVELEQVV